MKEDVELCKDSSVDVVRNPIAKGTKRAQEGVLYSHEVVKQEIVRTFLLLQPQCECQVK